MTEYLAWAITILVIAVPSWFVIWGCVALDTPDGDAREDAWVATVLVGGIAGLALAIDLVVWLLSFVWAAVPS